MGGWRPWGWILFFVDMNGQIQALWAGFLRDSESSCWVRATGFPPARLSGNDGSWLDFGARRHPLFDGTRMP